MTIEVDAALVAHAAAVLGTHRPKATVQRALEGVDVAEDRRRHARRLGKMDGIDLDQPEVTAEAWRYFLPASASMRMRRAEQPPPWSVRPQRSRIVLRSPGVFAELGLHAHRLTELGP